MKLIDTREDLLLEASILAIKDIHVPSHMRIISN